MCLLYDVMTSGTYFWNIVKKRVFLEKSVPLGAHTFATNVVGKNVRPPYVISIAEYGSSRIDSLGRTWF